MCYKAPVSYFFHSTICLKNLSVLLATANDAPSATPTVPRSPAAHTLIFPAPSPRLPRRRNVGCLLLIWGCREGPFVHALVPSTPWTKVGGDGVTSHSTQRDTCPQTVPSTGHSGPPPPFTSTRNWALLLIFLQNQRLVTIFALSPKLPLKLSYLFTSSLAFHVFPSSNCPPFSAGG